VLKLTVPKKKKIQQTTFEAALIIEGQNKYLPEIELRGDGKYSSIEVGDSLNQSCSANVMLLRSLLVL